jgi:hypothetical protein
MKMANTIETESFHLEIVSDDDDAIAQATQQLRTNLMNLDGIEAVERPSPSTGEDLGGAKGDALTLGALILAVAPGAVSATIDTLKEWLVRKSDETIRLKLQRGEQLVELEYNPATTSVDEIKTLVSALTPKDNS